MSDKEYTPKNILTLIGFGATVILSLAVLTACESDEPISNETLVAEFAACKESGRIPSARISQTSNQVIGVMCVPHYIWKPTITEFTLEDGTRCVGASTRPQTSRRAGFSGMSCDWKDNE